MRFQCRLDAGPWLACRSPVDYTGLVNGRHDFNVRAITRTGRKDPAPAHTAWLTAVVFSVLNAGLLSVRLRSESSALAMLGPA